MFLILAFIVSCVLLAVAISLITPKTKLRVIVVDGEIGAGKSTILEALADEYRARGVNVAVCPEPVAAWRRVGILDRFYKDPARYAYEFQTYTFVTRIMAVLECLECHPRATMLIMERSPLTDRHIFMELQREIVGVQTMQMYDEWCGLHMQLLPFNLKNATFVYLKPNLTECMTRMSTRARPEETENKTSDSAGKGGVSIEYQARLRAAHEALFQGETFLKTIIVDGEHGANSDFSKPGQARNKIVNYLIAKLGA